MKICMITSSYPRNPGDGAGSFVGSFARELVRQGHGVHVVAPYDPAVMAMDQGGVIVHRFRYAPHDSLHLVGHARSLEADVRMKHIVPLLMPGFIAAALAHTLVLQRRERFDLLHGHWAVPGGVIAGWAARLTGLPLVISLHGSDVYVIEHNRLYATLARAGFRRAGHVTACSEDLRSRAVAVGLDPTQASMLPYGVDDARYATGDGARMRARLGLPPDAPIVGAIGRLVAKKGFEHLLDALPALLARVPGAYCVLGGEGDLGQMLRARASRLGVAARVLFPGHIPWQDTPDFYALCDVIAIPSVVDAAGNVDGLPNVLLEAMASQRAVVASRVAGIPAVVREGVTGLLVPPGNAEALGAALGHVLTDQTLRQSLAREGQREIIQHYSIASMTHRLVAIYRAAIAERKGVGA